MQNSARFFSSPKKHASDTASTLSLLLPTGLRTVVAYYQTLGECGEQSTWIIGLTFSGGLRSLGRGDRPLRRDCRSLSAGLHSEKFRHLLSGLSALLVGDELGLEASVWAEVRVLVLLGRGGGGFGY